ncbi:protein adenylyltransferase SelO [Crocosphaera sp. Alani8]|uniref:protein adenylyltransferase SelO n=1 Tax=Crocosphaera sp. Alani8 TaxID=3038952 RepID=UPI00313C0596
MTLNGDNAFLNLNYEPALENLGDDYYDKVPAAQFPQHILRFRNDDLLPQLGLSSKNINDQHFIEAFGKFQGMRPFLALRYHGYQFGQYNPFLGDGRGFLYGQVRGVNGELYDFGTKGSGQTPYSRGGDGRLTLKGGVREVLAAETLHRMGVNTSRCLSLVETGESLWRGDEPSPTRSSVMIRVSHSHIRFGTFERLYHIKRPDLIKKLLDFVIDIYYQEIDLNSPDRYGVFYQELVKRHARLVAQWMAAGFCHGVLNTDNMSITGESFDYGPYAFIPTYDPGLTAAYFDYENRYCYGNQPLIVRVNLEMLHLPLMTIVSAKTLEASLNNFDDYYKTAYTQEMLKKLGLFGLIEDGKELVNVTVDALKKSQASYHQFFINLMTEINECWWKDESIVLENSNLSETHWENWRRIYVKTLNKVSPNQIDKIKETMNQFNSQIPLLRPQIESVWEAIANEDNWQPFNQLVKEIQAK